MFRYEVGFIISRGSRQASIGKIEKKKKNQVTCVFFHALLKNLEKQYPPLFFFLFYLLFFQNMSNREYSKEDIERMRIAMEGETALDRIKRKTKEEPLVPAGKREITIPNVINSY
jgi:hypothetical protein